MQMAATEERGRALQSTVDGLDKRFGKGVILRMGEKMQAGLRAAVFPEGTTSDGRRLLPFHGNLVQAALNAGAPMVPIGIRYVDPDGEPSHAAIFIGDTTFLQSLWAITGHPKVIVEVHVLPAIAPAPGLKRQEAARRARAAIGDALGRYRFVIDLDGHVEDERVADALLGLKRFSPRVQFLGSYRRADGHAPLVMEQNSDETFVDARMWLQRLVAGEEV